MADERRYWAFLSHSHRDVAWAAWLHRALEDYAVPSRLVGRMTPGGPLPRRLRPIFRDRDEFAASASLRAEIRSALERSSCLIVICSPAAAGSEWVNEEIRLFRALHGDSRVLTVIVDGHPNGSRQGDGTDDCFPPALRERAPAAQGAARGAARKAGRAAGDGDLAHPIAADLRPHGDGRRLALLKLLAGMMGVGLDELVQREAHRRQARLTAIAAASFAGMLAMGALAATAIAGRNAAVRQRAQAEGLIEFMLVDLRKSLEPAGRLDALDAVGQRALKYYAAQSSGRLDADALGRRSRVLHLIGDLRDQRGDLAAALKVFQEAADSTGELLRRAPDDPRRIFDHAQSVYWVGYIAWRRGQMDEATRRFADYKRLAEQLTAIDPANDDWRAEVGYANSNLGTVLLEAGRPAEAAAAFRVSLETSRILAAHRPGERDLQADLAQSYAWCADAAVMLGDLPAALGYRRAERGLYLALLARQPADADAARGLMVNRTATARILGEKGQGAAALAEARQATRDAERLMASDPDNTQFREQAVPAFIGLGLIQLQAGDGAAALSSARRARALAEGLVARDPSVAAWRGPQLGAARVLEMKVAAQGAGAAPGVVAALAPAEAEFRRLEALGRARPGDIMLARVTGEAAALAGDARWLAGDRAGALVLWRAGAQALARARADGPDLRFDPVRRGLDRLKARIAGGPLGRAARRENAGLPDYAW